VSRFLVPEGIPINPDHCSHLDQQDGDRAHDRWEIDPGKWEITKGNQQADRKTLSAAAILHLRLLPQLDGTGVEAGKAWRSLLVASRPGHRSRGHQGKRMRMTYGSQPGSLRRRAGLCFAIAREGLWLPACSSRFEGPLDLYPKTALSAYITRGRRLEGWQVSV